MLAALLWGIHYCREYKILNLLEFNSKRKRMSVIVKDETGKILLLCKGADTYVNFPFSCCFEFF